MCKNGACKSHMNTDTDIVYSLDNRVMQGILVTVTKPIRELPCQTENARIAPLSDIALCMVYTDECGHIWL